MFSPVAISAPSRKSSLAGGLTQRVTVGLAATLVLALASRIAFPLPFTPVPLSLQPLAVLVVGLLLGPVDGTLAVLAYLAEGALGLPVFSPTGPGGLLQLLGPTGGYLLADPAVAFLAGFTVRRVIRRGATSGAGLYWRAVTGCVLATAVLFASGALWLAHLHPMTTHALWIVAVAPFLPGEAVKILVAAGIYRTFHSGFAH